MSSAAADASKICPICCDKYDKSLHSEVKCYLQTCQFACCKTCVRTYLTGVTTDPHCMHCRNKWNLEFAKANLNASFMDNDYRTYRKVILADREIAKTSEYYEGALYHGQTSEAHKRLQEIKVEIKELNNQIDAKERLLEDIETEIATFGRKKAGNQPARKFIMPCQNADCRGLLSSQYKCDLCSKFTCSKCLLCIQGEKEEHICNTDDIATAEEIRKNTKPCPNCGSRISKIDGCDQMFCVECKTAFSWNKGTVETGNIHNPHYYEWLRKNGGNAAMPAANLRNGCDNDFQAVGRYLQSQPTSSTRNALKRIKEYTEDNTMLRYVRKVPGAWDLSAFNATVRDLLKHNSDKLDEKAETLSRFHQFVNHIDGDELAELRRSLQRNADNHTAIYNYILNRIDKQELSNDLIRLDTDNMRWRARSDILEALVMVGRQLLTDCVADLKKCNENQVVIPRYQNEHNYYRMREEQWNSERYEYLTKVKELISNNDLFKNETEAIAIMTNYETAILKYATYSNIESIRHLLTYNSKKILELWVKRQNGNDGRSSISFSTKTEMYQKMNEFQRLYDQLNGTPTTIVHKMLRAPPTKRSKPNTKAESSSDDEVENMIVGESTA